MTNLDRRHLLRATGVAAVTTALTAGAALGAATPAAARPTRSEADPSSLLTGPLIGTWRGTASRPDEVEVAVFTFFPGGIFTSFAEGIHISAGRWTMTGPNTFAFSLWQVLPDDLEGLPHRYHGEVQAMHEGRVDGDTLTSKGTGRRIDQNGKEIGRGPVRVQATRFGLNLF
ncbi:hypothetical protein N8J89_23685 [Crossiella sp. CA-258035]|uniref:hypothetical protein n=1 Tax=Crossiella sp. CA-258035 TaxID=2981138 RepID=UPI0024BD1ED8|nr:hypothetical protein [Crossiella sp. CA-258035]WHT16133.1 hypothetical protein N8J89_23685 [Crossiella sp. CA-258035]